MSASYTVDIKVGDDSYMTDVEINDIQGELDELIENARKEVEDLTEEEFNKRFPDNDYEDMGNMLEELEDKILQSITFDLENDESDNETYIDDIDYDDIDKLVEVVETLNADNYNLHDRLVAYTEAMSSIDTIDELESAIEECEDMDFYPDMDMESLAEQFVDDGLFGEVGEGLKNYIDYEAIARDLAYDYTLTSKGIIRMP